MARRIGRLGGLVFALGLAAASAALAADDGVWRVQKSSGEVWISATGAQPATLKQEDALKPGDTISTGRNGRVLLVRGEESILISPNSVIGIPTEKKDGLATTILQRAGSIVLDVEKKNVKHFEVETPYLAAVVKGTQFIVTVGDKSTSVDVKRGQVEVSDFKTGQIAQVMPGQAATISSNDRPGLVLSGSGTFNPIEQGKPRTPSVQPVMVPKGGLMKPQRAQTSGGVRQSAGASQIKPTAALATHLSGGEKTGGFRITTALGEVKLNFNKVTKGLSHGTTPTFAVGRNAASAAHDNTSVWSGAQSGSSAVASTSQGSSGNGGGTASGASSAASSGNAAAPSSVIGPAVISVANAPDDPGKGPAGGPGKKAGGGAANAAGGNGPDANGPPGRGPAGNGPPGQGGAGSGNGGASRNGGENGHGPGGNGPPGHGH